MEDQKESEDVAKARRLLDYMIENGYDVLGAFAMWRAGECTGSNMLAEMDVKMDAVQEVMDAERPCNFYKAGS